PLVERRAGARRTVPPVRNLSHQAKPLLPARRGRRAPRRREYRALRANAQPIQDAHPVHRHHAQPADDNRGRRRCLRCNDAGAGRFVDRQRAHARCDHRRHAAHRERRRSKHAQRGGHYRRSGVTGPRLTTLVFAWKYGQLPPRSAPLELLGPVGTRALIERLAAAYGEWLLAPGFPITIREIAPGESVELSASVRLTAQKVPHTEESVAYSI